MTDEQSKPVTSGAGDATLDAGSAVTEEGKAKEDFVAYSTYKKTMTELSNNKAARKDLEAQLNEYKSREEEAQRKRLEEQGEYKKLLEIERKKNEEFVRERDEYRDNLITAHKLNAFKEKLPSPLSRPDYYTFVDVDGIVIDPETNTIDDSSVDAVVNSFMANHSGLLASTGKKLPHDAPQSRSNLTYQEWLKLPVKEKRSRMHEVMHKE